MRRSLEASSLCPGQGTRMMREPDVQIGNSGSVVLEMRRRGSG
jgi:hypothetical protein